jgi:quinol-cytochrome oxidoreductase complex cytochrome b subunit
MGAPPPPAPEPSPDPKPPRWCWETFTSLGLIVVFFLLPDLYNDVSLLRNMSENMLLTLVVSFLTFGAFLGLSGARQGGRANQIVAILAMVFHMLLMFYLLRMLDLLRTPSHY